MNVLADELSKAFDEVFPFEFYRDIFPVGELDVWSDNRENMHKGKYCGIVIQITKKKNSNGKPFVKRYSVTDDLSVLEDLFSCDDFCVISPISYAGKTRISKNARFMYGLVVELDNLKVSKSGKQIGLYELINQWGEKVSWIPCPTYCVASGTGIHLYYLFERPLPLFENVVRGLQVYKRQLTEKIWNRNVTTTFTKETIQQESIFQGFRMVGTITKRGDRVRAFKVGNRVSIDYMNSFISADHLRRHPECKIENIYKSNLTKEEAKNKYPEWFEKRIKRKEAKGHWICNKAVYDWWLSRIRDEAVVGHRYYCLMMLAIYAVKCDVSQDELEKDCLSLLDIFESRTDSDSNHFTEKDVLDALQSFEDKDLITYPINSISNRSGLLIEKNKRNGRNRELHLKLARASKAILKEAGEIKTEGRPSKEAEVIQYLKRFPNNKNISDIARKCGVARNTIYKYIDK